MNIKGIKLPASTFVHSHQEKKCKLWAFHPDCHHPHCGQFSSLVRFCLVISFSVCYYYYQHHRSTLRTYAAAAVVPAAVMLRDDRMGL